MYFTLLKGILVIKDSIASVVLSLISEVISMKISLLKFILFIFSCETNQMISINCILFLLKYLNKLFFFCFVVIIQSAFCYFYIRSYIF